MEDRSTSNAIVVIHNDQKKENINGGKKKKRFSLFRTAMFLLRNRPNEKPAATNIFNVPKCNDNSKSDGKWKKFVGSIRPLHMQEQDSLSTPPQSPVPDKAFCVASTSTTISEDDFCASSPALSTTSWGTTSYASTTSLQDLVGSGGTMKQNSLRKMSDNMNRYASALNLHDLDIDEEVEEEVEDDDDNVLENCVADNMIDAKADEFIARFYQQMRSQH